MINNQELTIYKNELNSVPFRKFNTVEMNLFFAICTKMREKNLQKIRHNFDELKELSKYKDLHKERFVNDLEQVYKKMLQLSYRKENKKTIQYFILFNGFLIDKEKSFVEISINPELKYILNEISGEFTKFELEEFTSLRSSYTKTAFRLLKQFRQTGFWKIRMEDFRELLDIPVSYQSTDINRRILKPIEKELTPFFENLEIKKIKAKKQNKIEYLEFSFKSQDDIRKNGIKIFKDNNGNYYENDIEHFTKEEIDKSFPTP